MDSRALLSCVGDWLVDPPDVLWPPEGAPRLLDRRAFRPVGVLALLVPCMLVAAVPPGECASELVGVRALAPDGFTTVS